MKSIFTLFVATLLVANHAHAERPSTESRNPIRVGVVLGFTGGAEIWSAYSRQGLELARDEINSAGGVRGRPLEFVFEDSQTQPARSVSAYRKLVTIDRVPVVIGNTWAFITNPLIPLAKSDRVLLIAPAVVPESVEQPNEFFFTMGHPVASTRKAVDRFFARNTEVRKVGLFCTEDTWGHAYLRVWREIAAERGVAIAVTACGDFNTIDPRSYVSRMASEKVDAVIIGHLADVIIHRMREQHFFPKVLTTSNTVADLLMKKAPAELYEGVFATDWMPSQPFIDTFRARYGIDPAAEAHNSYETVRSLGKALEVTSRDLGEALRTVHYEGVAGPIDFSGGSFVSRGEAKLYRIEGGRLMEIK